MKTKLILIAVTVNIVVYGYVFYNFYQDAKVRSYNEGYTDALNYSIHIRKMSSKELEAEQKGVQKSIDSLERLKNDH